MSFILVSLLLLAIFLLATVIYDVTNIADSTHYDPYNQEPLSPITEFCLSEWAVSKSEYRTETNPQNLCTQQPSTPFRLQLNWNSDSMAKLPECSHAGSIENNESAAVPRVMKRFSIQLPLTSSSSLDASSSEVEIPRSTSPKEVMKEPDSGSFLVALAAQERRVLELKEELHKAESDLTKLKRQWAHHEALRKRQEIQQQAQPLRSIKSPTQSIPLMQEGKGTGGLATRRSTTTARTRQIQRKVFEGGRHTRALSLLSPTSMANRGSISGHIEVHTEKPRVEPGPKTAIPRISIPVHAKQQSLDIPKEDIVATGIQIMDDLKEGLWTFIEDLRQATVGEEALSPSRIRHGVSLNGIQNKMVNTMSDKDLATLNQASSQSTSTILKQSGVDAAFPLLPVVSALPQTITTVVRNSSASKASKTSSDDDDEVWDTWASPPRKDVSLNCSSTTRSTPRSSVR